MNIYQDLYHTHKQSYINIKCKWGILANVLVLFWKYTEKLCRKDIEEYIMSR